MIEPCRLCRSQGRTFDGTLPIFKRALPGGFQGCLICDGSGRPDYILLGT
ncbi:hypothetical protein ACIBEJ_48765 [Nonomuraea sp. NPDC050790]